MQHFQVIAWGCPKTLDPAMQQYRAHRAREPPLPAPSLEETGAMEDSTAVVNIRRHFDSLLADRSNASSAGSSRLDATGASLYSDRSMGLPSFIGQYSDQSTGLPSFIGQ